MVELPEVGYTLPTAASLIGCHPKSIYRIVKRGDLEAFVDASGRLVVSKEELYSYIKRKEGDS
jgi:predicted site-specific integrase-resolvase